MYFEPIKFVENLGTMGIGMLGVFMIVGIIMGATYLIGFITKRMEEMKNSEE